MWEVRDSNGDGIVGDYEGRWTRHPWLRDNKRQLWEGEDFNLNGVRDMSGATHPVGTPAPASTWTTAEMANMTAANVPAGSWLYTVDISTSDPMNETDPNGKDRDPEFTNEQGHTWYGDGIPDGYDSDGDELNDGWETWWGLNPMVHSPRAEVTPAFGSLSGLPAVFTKTTIFTIDGNLQTTATETFHAVYVEITLNQTVVLYKEDLAAMLGLEASVIDQVWSQFSSGSSIQLLLQGYVAGGARSDADGDSDPKSFSVTSYVPGMTWAQMGGFLIRIHNYGNIYFDEGWSTLPGSTTQTDPTHIWTWEELQQKVQEIQQSMS